MKIDLKELGFSQKEQDVYLALLKWGQLPASVLARHLNIKRTTIYDPINALLRNNLISVLLKNNVAHYYVDDIRKIYFLEKQKADLARKMLPELEAIRRQSPGVQMRYYQGREAYRELYETILRSRPKEILAWLNLDAFYKELDMEREEQWTKERVKNKIHARLILVESELSKDFSRKDKENYRETCFLKKEKPFNAACFLYEGHLAFFNPTDNVSGIDIADPQFFDLQLQLFETQWATLKSR